MNLVDSLNNTNEEPRVDLLITHDDFTYDWNIASTPNIISNNLSSGTINVDYDSISISRTPVELSDETINTIAERVYDLIRRRGIE